MTKNGVNGPMNDTNDTSVTKTYTPEQLDSALYNATDILQRCLLGFILLGDTAKDVKAGPEILTESDGIYIGIPKNQLIPEVISNLRTFANNKDLNYGMEDYQESLTEISWKHGGVPIHVQIIHRKYKFFDRPDIKFYRLEEYRIPNPWDAYWKARYLVK